MSEKVLIIHHYFFLYFVFRLLRQLFIINVIKHFNDVVIKLRLEIRVRCSAVR
jgi:hypothetical protein